MIINIKQDYLNKISDEDINTSLDQLNDLINIPRRAYGLVFDGFFGPYEGQALRYGLKMDEVMLDASIFILDRHDMPTLIPLYLAEIVESDLPSNWYFGFHPTDRPNKVIGKIGYREFALDPAHFDGVFSGDRQQRQIMYKRIQANKAETS
jgi:hypothetical protein